MTEKGIQPIIFDEEHHKLLETLRQKGPAHQKLHFSAANLGAKISDTVAATVGSWPFIVIQSTLLLLWILANILGWIKSWDPYPFILLNLVLSFQAAYTAPIIMMSQNRQSLLDRAKAEKDYDVNLKAELEIELLHQKMDMMREQEIKRLTLLIEELSESILNQKK
jgi:uncharacterized membrane protein